MCAQYHNGFYPFPRGERRGREDERIGYRHLALDGDNWMRPECEGKIQNPNLCYYASVRSIRLYLTEQQLPFIDIKHGFFVLALHKSQREKTPHLVYRFV